MKFYTYLHIRLDDNKIFYIGKGSGKRAWTTKRSKHWHAVESKHGCKVEISAKWPTEKEAHDHEIFLIDCFKKLNHPLVNKTDGGEGTAGLTPWNKGLRGCKGGVKVGEKRPGIGGVKKGNIPWNKGKTYSGIPCSDEKKNNIKEAKKKKPWSPTEEQKAKMRASAKNRWIKV
jgi:hypothetical protein